jgi:hypothetical protein
MIVNGDGGNAGWLVVVFDQRLDIDPSLAEALPELGPEGISPDSTDKADVSTESPSRNCLVSALAARKGRKPGAKDGFARFGKPRCPDDEVHVRTAYHDERHVGILAGGDVPFGTPLME